MLSWYNSCECQEIGEVLKLPENVIPVVGFALGYQEKEVLGIKRYLKNKAMAERIKSHPEINLAQIYTEIKYTEESHQKYSMDLLNYLCE